MKNRIKDMLNLAKDMIKLTGLVLLLIILVLLYTSPFTVLVYVAYHLISKYW